ncbi:retrovirus-related pol polyprotein from transposon TNT 1-94 [Tanacetum coccineum]
MKNGSLANNSQMKMETHTGTHVDAPGHVFDRYFDLGFDVDTLDLYVLNDAGDQETNQPSDLTDYQLTRDREPRTRTKPLRFQDESNIAAYAFAAAEEEDTHEPLLAYQEAVACEDSSKWKAAMEEEMDSLRKNKT